MSDDIDVDELLAQEASQFVRDQEVDRILKSFPLDAYSILDLQPGCSSQVIKQQYRKKSLLIHPDKTKNPQAPDAFDRLKKAEATLQDDKKRELLDQAFTDARRMLIHEKKWTYDDQRLRSDEFLQEWRIKTKEVLIESELRKRKLQRIQMEEEGRAKRKLEEAEEERRKKRQSEQAWEDARDTRVENWRGYQKKVNKKKKANKVNVLG
jgi:DnaJ family protein C protein 8